MSKVKAIIFDLDGVLIEAKEWHYEALNRALSIFGMEISRHDHLTKFDGLPTRRKIEILSKEEELPCELHEFINSLKQTYTMEAIYANCKPRFDHQYALSRLKREKFVLTVATNSVRDSLELMLTRAGLIEFLEFYLSNEDVERAKPDPEIFSTSFRRLNMEPHECLILEDNHNGLRAAEESGAHVMQVIDVQDVNYWDIIRRIKKIEEA